MHEFQCFNCFNCRNCSGHPPFISLVQFGLVVCPESLRHDPVWPYTIGILFSISAIVTQRKLYEMPLCTVLLLTVARFYHSLLLGFMGPGVGIMIGPVCRLSYFLEWFLFIDWARWTGEGIYIQQGILTYSVLYLSTIYASSYLWVRANELYLIYIQQNIVDFLLLSAIAPKCYLKKVSM